MKITEFSSEMTAHYKRCNCQNGQNILSFFFHNTPHFFPSINAHKIHLNKFSYKYIIHIFYYKKYVFFCIKIKTISEIYVYYIV